LIGPIRRVRIFSLEGDLIYSSDSEHPEESEVDDINEVIESLRGSSSMLLKSEAGADVLEYFAPLRDTEGNVYAVCELYFDISTDPNLAQVHISGLRQKLESHGPRILHTVRGIGYRLELSGS